LVECEAGEHAFLIPGPVHGVLGIPLRYEEHDGQMIVDDVTSSAGRFSALSLRRLRQRVPTSGAVAGSIAAGLYAQAALVVTGVVSTRALGPTDRGYFALLLLLPAVLQQLGSLGLPLATTYFIAHNRTQEGPIRRLIRLPAATQVIGLTLIQAGILWFLL